MKRILVLLAILAANASAEILWYNGNYDNNGGLTDELNGGGFLGVDGFVYDNFQVPAGVAWKVTDLIGYIFADTGTIQSAQYEIREGVSSGNGGILIASGSGATATWTATATTLFNVDLGETLTLYQLDIPVTGIALASGTYWLGLQPALDPTQDQNAFAASTSGAGATGYVPGNAYWSSNFFGADFDLTTDDGEPADYSDGIDGTQKSVATVPEPAPLAMLAFVGLAVLGGRRR